MIVLYSVKYRTSTGIIQVETPYSYHNINHSICQSAYGYPHAYPL